MPLDNWIKLNVGGKPLLTTLQTLMSSPDSVLAKMFDPDSGFQPPYSEDGVYFLNADPMYFGVILNWLRYRRIMAHADIDMANLKHVADYYGIVELIEALPLPPVPPAEGPVLPVLPVPPVPPMGQWMEEADAAPDKLVNGMDLAVSTSFGPSAQIIQLPDGKLSVELSYANMPPGKKFLTSDARGESVWVPTKAGRLPPGAIAFEGEEGEKLYIGRKLWVQGGTNRETAIPLQVLRTEDGVPVIPNHAIISLGYVNEEGIWDINYSESVQDILERSTGDPIIVDHILEMREQGMINGVTCTSSQFEVLCIF